MKLLYSDFSPPLLLDEGCVCSLVVENGPALRRLVMDLQQQIAGAKGDCVLSDADAPIDMAKYAELFVQLVPFSCNRRTLLSRVLDAAEQKAINTDHFEQTHSLYAAIERYLLELGEEFSLSVDAERITVSGLFKLAGAAIEEDQTDMLGTILDYMDLVAELEREKVFFFVHLRSYFSDEEMQLFFSSARQRKHRIIMLESTEHPLLEEEKRIIIDADLCAILL